MARRAGKAASRRARQQRRAQRPTPPPSTAAPPPSATAPPVDAVVVEGLAVEPREEPRRASAPVVSAPSPARAYASGGSTLTDRERAEYHYVERDLRNIGILTAILFALLIAAWFVSSAIRGF
jgi:hypothetical protein